MPRLDWTYLGTVSYRRALQLQYDYAQRAAELGPRVFFLQHPPTVTLGRQADETNLKLSEAEYARRGIELVRVLRGGDVTYHGPGQLVGYPVAALDSAACSVPDWVAGNANAIIDFLGRHGIQGSWSDTHPGVWVGPEKIAALGFHISRRVSTHGFALNLATDLSCFETIVPCGLNERGITSMEKLGVVPPTMEEASGLLARLLARTFGWSLGEGLLAKSVFEEASNGDSTRAMVS